MWHREHQVGRERRCMRMCTAVEGGGCVGTGCLVRGDNSRCAANYLLMQTSRTTALLLYCRELQAKRCGFDSSALHRMTCCSLFVNASAHCSCTAHALQVQHQLLSSPLRRWHGQLARTQQASPAPDTAAGAQCAMHRPWLSRLLWHSTGWHHMVFICHVLLPWSHIP